MSIQRPNFSSVSLPSSNFAEPLPLGSTSSPSVRPLSLSGDPSSGSCSAEQIREISQDPREEQNDVHILGERERHATSISMLPDNVLLTIFDFYRKDQDYGVDNYRDIQWISWKWHLLVHVCHRWRQIVFASPRRLYLQIPCTLKTPLNKSLDIWPAFPIIVVYDIRSSSAPIGEDNIFAALRRPDRVCEVRFALFPPRLRAMVAVMQEPFPVLRRLYISSDFGSPQNVLSTGFLGGSAPCLQEISISGVPYPALPTLLLSTRDLVKLSFSDIPSDDYISPEPVVASLAALPRLETFTIGVQRVHFRADQIHPPPPTRTVLPVLTSFTLRGDSEYIEDLVGRIDSPLLDHISISYVDWHLGFQITQLSKFLDRSVGHKLTKCRHAEVEFSPHGRVTFKFCRRENDSDLDGHLATVVISYQWINWQVTPISQVLSQFPATLDNVVHLVLKRRYERAQSPGPEIEWSHLLRQFSAVQTLLVQRGLSQHVALALEDIPDEMATEFLTSLALICLEGEQPPLLDKFVAARQHSDCPVTVVDTIQEFKERREAYISQ